MALFSNGGYDYEFVDTPSDITECKICHLPSRDPYLSVCCGHVYCKSCLDNAKKITATSSACPMCRDEQFTVYPNKQLDRIVRSLRIFCTNKSRGCKWQGEVNGVTEHLRDCWFEETECNKCEERMQRQYLTIHAESQCLYRTVTCQYCRVKTTFCHIEEHKRVCPKLPLSCPNQCDIGSVAQENMESHKKSCPLEIVQCEYYSVGCTDTMPRKDLKEHNKLYVEKHLTLTTCELSKAREMTSITHKLDVIQNDTVDTREYIQQRFMKLDKEMIAVKQELDAVTAATLETKGFFIQKLVHTDRELTSVKQELAAIRIDVTKTRNEMVQKLTRTEREMANLTKLATAQRDAMDKLTKQVKENSDKLTKCAASLPSNMHRESEESDSDDGYFNTSGFKLNNKPKPVVRKHW